MPGIGPRIPAAERQPHLADLDTAARLYYQAGQEGEARGRAQADWEIAAALLDRNQAARTAAEADAERARYGPDGRAHFADPRPGDFPGRGRPEHEQEAEAG